ncbi:MAG: phosphate ABC transporter permease PstA [Euryarchaeota archaeon]|nr:phosphate ABC transporter permease PstA [Euryarchaeota archaeon]
MLSFRQIKDKIFVGLVLAGTFAALFPLFHIICTVVIMGLPAILSRGLVFFTGTLSQGGIGPALYGTFMLAFLSSLIGLPVAFLVGLFVYEYPESKLGGFVKSLLQIMLEFPTILVGVFVMSIMVIPMGTYSALAGAFALAIIMIPYVAVYTAEAMHHIPTTYREASFSLGLSRVKSVFHVLVPMAKRGIMTGVLIAIAKVAGETAPLLFTAGGLYETYPQGVTSPVGAIPLLIYTLIQSPSPADHATAWGAALVLLLIFIGVFVPIRMSLKEVKM